MKNSLYKISIRIAVLELFLGLGAVPATLAASDLGPMTEVPVGSVTCPLAANGGAEPGQFNVPASDRRASRPTAGAASITR